MPGFTRRKRGRPPSPGTFTPAEERLLPLIARGLTNSEIAAQTGLSAHTVHSHIASMLSKAGAKDRQELGRIEPARRPDGARALFGLPLRIATGVLATATLTVAVAAIALAARGDDAGTPATPPHTPFPT
jgi:DNA-binding CsgD family transcriptional regulator